MCYLDFMSKFRWHMYAQEWDFNTSLYMYDQEWDSTIPLIRNVRKRFCLTKGLITVTGTTNHMDVILCPSLLAFSTVRIIFTMKIYFNNFVIGFVCLYETAVITNEIVCFDRFCLPFVCSHKSADIPKERDYFDSKNTNWVWITSIFSKVIERDTWKPEIKSNFTGILVNSWFLRYGYIILLHLCRPNTCCFCLLPLVKRCRDYFYVCIFRPARIFTLSFQLLIGVMSNNLRAIVSGISRLGRGTAGELPKIEHPQDRPQPSPGTKRSRSKNTSLNSSSEVSKKKTKGVEIESLSSSDTSSEFDLSDSSVVGLGNLTGSSQSQSSSIIMSAADELHIVHRNHPVTKLVKEQVKQIFDEIGSAIDLLIKTGGKEVPLFGRHIVKDDMLVMRPENQYSRQFIVDLIEVGMSQNDFPELQVLVEVAAPAAAPETWHKYSVRIPDDGATIQEMFSRLKAQNNGLITEGWKVDHKKEFAGEDTVWFILRVPEGAHRFISEKKNTLYYGLTKVRFVSRDTDKNDEYVGKRRRQ